MYSASISARVKPPWIKTHTKIGKKSARQKDIILISNIVGKCNAIVHSKEVLNRALMKATMYYVLYITLPYSLTSNPHNMGSEEL